MKDLRFFKRINSKSKLLHTQWTVMILIKKSWIQASFARAIGKNAALLSNLWPNASGPHVVRELRDNDVQEESQRGT